MHRETRRSAKSRRVVDQPLAGAAFHSGVCQIVGAVRPTLGPLPKMAAIAPVVGQRPPELLDDGGLIVRRITALPDNDADMGAMFVRSMLWRLYQEVGDGTATAAVLFEAVYASGRRYLASGGNAMRLRQFLEQGLGHILDHLSGQAKPADHRATLTAVARTAGADALLADMLGEIFDIVGEWGVVELRSGRGRTLERIYIEGMQWDGGILSSHLYTDSTAREARIDDAAVVVSDFAITEPDELLPVIDLAKAHQFRSVFISCRSISDRAISLLVVNRQPDVPRVVVARGPVGAPASHGELIDLSMLVGGRALTTFAGDSLREIQIGDIGRARRAWSNHDSSGVAAGQGDPRALRRHILSLKAAVKATDDLAEQASLARRIGHLTGGSAILQVGGATAPEINHRKAVAERTARTVRSAVQNGVLAGGGTALAACRHVLAPTLEASQDPDERAAYRILQDALIAPIRTIATNTGLDPSVALADIHNLCSDQVFDARSGSVVNMYDAGIIDSASVVVAGARSAISSAALALTIDVLVHSKHPEEVLEP